MIISSALLPNGSLPIQDVIHQSVVVITVLADGFVKLTSDVTRTIDLKQALHVRHRLRVVLGEIDDVHCL